MMPKLTLWPLTKISFYRENTNNITGYQAISLIPKDASVVARDAIASHHSERQKIYDLTPSAPSADYIIADQSLNYWPNKNYSEIY